MPPMRPVSPPPRPPRAGRFLGLPYDWRPPTRARAGARWWNPAARRLLTPPVFGWGYGLNLYELARRLRLVRERPPGPGDPDGADSPPPRRPRRAGAIRQDGRYARGGRHRPPRELPSRRRV